MNESKSSCLDSLPSVARSWKPCGSYHLLLYSLYALGSIFTGRKKLDTLHSLQAMQIFEPVLIIGAFQADPIIHKLKFDSQEPSEEHLQ